LGDYKDITECLVDAGQSDQEDAAPIEDTLRKKPKRASQSKKITLQEIGPRMQLQLIKVHDGLCKGKVHYYKFATAKKKKSVETIPKDPDVIET